MTALREADAGHAAAGDSAPKTVLNVGSGLWAPHKLHAFFRSGHWNEVRVDIDVRVRPDVVADVTDLSAFGDGSVDAVWSSHNLEHLHDHQVPLALREFLRVLRGDGLVLLTMPDLQAVAEMIAAGQCEEVAYESPAGPITPLDMVYGHRPSIAAGNVHMVHRTGFTRARLRRMLAEAGFTRNHVFRGRNMDLWGVALMPDTDPGVLAQLFRKPVSVL
ncbi:class I SAM-dependent methyltransferase [Pseudochelatococcus sp. B33]